MRRRLAGGPQALPVGTGRLSQAQERCDRDWRKPRYAGWRQAADRVAQVTGFGFSFRGHLGWHFLKEINTWARFNQGQRH